MAGLLDFFGDGFDDPRSAAMMALASGLLQRNGAGGLVAGVQAYSQAKQDGLKRGLLEAQINETKAQADERKLKLLQDQRRQQNDDEFMGRVPASTAGDAAPGGGGPAASGGGFSAQAISQQFGIPIEAVMADYRMNGGKKIAELIDSRTKPNWQNINGNLVNTNAQGFQGGIQAGMSAGQGGQVTAWQPDGQGGLVVGAPRGALDTFRAYQNVGEKAKADMDPFTVPATPGGRPTLTTRGAFVEGQQPSAPRPMQGAGMPQPQAGVTGNFTGDPAGVMEGIAQIRDPQERANAMAAFQEQARRTRGFTQGIALQTDAEAAGDKARAEALGKGEAERTNTKTGRTDKAGDMLGMIERAKMLLEHGDPTASGIGSLMDKGLGFVGATTRSAQSASALDNIASTLTMNVPRMEGPQGVLDVNLYETSAGKVGDRTLPVAERMAALNQLQQLQQKYAGASSTTAKPAKTVVKTGVYGGKKVIQYSDGTVEYAN